MVEGGDRPRFTLEPVIEVARGNLDGHIAAQASVHAAINLAHAARADERRDLIGAKLVANRETHAGAFYTWDESVN